METDKHIKTIETILLTAATNGASLVQEIHVPALRAALDALRHIADDEQMERDGLLVRLPCKVGDTVYRRYMDCEKPHNPTHCTDHEGSCECCGHRTPIALPRAFDYDMIPFVGTRIFLTAEAALEEQK